MAQQTQEKHIAPVPELADVVQWIKEEIIFGRLRPRERLVEEELSERFGVSRHLIRAAFADLQNMGLVNRRRNKGAMVRDFSAREVDEIYEMRSVLQREAAMRIALPAEDELLEKLERIHAEFSTAVEIEDLQRVCSLNNEFHFTIFNAANNQYLSDMLERIWTETLGIRCYAIGDPVWLKRARDDHAQIIEALRNGDQEQLVKLVDAHIWPALELYKRAHGGWQESRRTAAG